MSKLMSREEEISKFVEIQAIKEYQYMIESSTPEKSLFHLAQADAFILVLSFIKYEYFQKTKDEIKSKLSK